MAPAAPVFRIPPRQHAVEVFRADLSVAGIAYRDDTGRVADFHALRHTFITNLAAGGVHPKIAQLLARHSTIMLTMDRYTHQYAGDVVEALAVLPDLSRPSANQVAKTGTDDALATKHPHLKPHQWQRETMPPGTTGRNRKGHVEQRPNRTIDSHKSLSDAEQCNDVQRGAEGRKAERVGFEPTVTRRLHRFSKPARSAAPAPLHDRSGRRKAV